MQEKHEFKATRMLDIYSELCNGKILKKGDLANLYGVTNRSIQRDMDALRCYLSDHGLNQEIQYDVKAGGYRIVRSMPHGLTNSEILSICKILLESRSMRKDEMLPILDSLLECTVPEESRQAVTRLIGNEKLHYIEPHHQKKILPGLWDIGQAVSNQQVIEIEYERIKEPKLVRRQIWPVGIMFSEYYFYLTAFLKDKTDFENPDDMFPTIYRIDRIQSFRVLNEHFSVPYKNRFQEGEFRKRVQFMYGGKLQRVKFQYSGPSIEAVLDRLPTAEAVEQSDGTWIVTAEAFGKGIEMWLRSQGDYIR